jgi:hypothetical protein
MVPLSEFEIHAPIDDGIESWVTIIHKRCGASLGEWDMVDLEEAVSLAVDHKCPTATGPPATTNEEPTPRKGNSNAN